MATEGEESARLILLGALNNYLKHIGSPGVVIKRETLAQVTTCMQLRALLYVDDMFLRKQDGKAV